MADNYPVPQTPALRQVSRHSLQELFSRDPEAYTRVELDAIIAEMRDLRDRLASTETTKAVRQVRVAAPAPKGVGDPDALGI
jgi:hypothetical protein